MMDISKKFFFIKVSENWFSCRSKFTDAFMLKAYLDIKNAKPSIPLIKKTSYTVQNSLEEDEDTIFSNFSESNRTKIRKAEREGIRCYFHKDIEGFVEIYNRFAKVKKISLISCEKLRSFGSNLRISYAVLPGKVLAAHSYLIDEQLGISVGGYSASIRFNNKADASQAGRANKLLHYKDMLCLKEEGIKIYDWGGYAKDTRNENLKGINDFKLTFGGQVVECTNYYTIPYFLFHKIAKFAGLLGKG